MGQAAVSEQQQPDHFHTDLSVGEILRRTRIHYEQSLPDIERALRIRASQLEALENGNYAMLPGRVYIIGFIRSYSEYLGLDGDKMVNLFKKQVGGRETPSPTMNYPVMASDTKMPQFWQIGVSVAAAVVILAVWFGTRGEDRTAVTEVPPVAESAAPAATTQPETPATALETAGQTETTRQAMPPQPAPVQNAPPPEPAVPGTATAAAAPSADTAVPPPKEEGIILNINENSWVEIRGKDGKSIVSRVLQAGDRYYVPDRPDLTISLGNSGGVTLEVDGKKLKPLGAPGEVKRNVPLDMAFLKKNYGQGD
ncbi:MAG: helix-turn-helix domain-containing protein [Alphaproteobacteria bacterium PRO2]|nr:helix-turn-helix domain-containing protein [Alphaproteobacteria bacterium PRO2]